MRYRIKELSGCVIIKIDGKERGAEAKTRQPLMNHRR